MTQVIRHADGSVDHRYTVELEWCGQPEPKPVARFCGDWIGWAETKEGAWKLAADFSAKRRNVDPNMIPDGGVLFLLQPVDNGLTFVSWDMTGVGSTAGHVQEHEGKFTARLDTSHPDIGEYDNLDRAMWAVIMEFARNKAAS